MARLTGMDSREVETPPNYKDQTTMLWMRVTLISPGRVEPTILSTTYALREMRTETYRPSLKRVSFDSSSKGDQSKQLLDRM